MKRRLCSIALRSVWLYYFFVLANCNPMPKYNIKPKPSGIHDLMIVLLIGIVGVLGCTSTNRSETDPDAPKTERGRLKFAKSLHALRIGNSYAYRDVNQALFFNGTEWKPPGDEDLANRVGGCDASPDPKLEMLRCSGGFTESYRTTYLVRIKDDRPEVKKIDEDCGAGPMWIDMEGRWMLLQKCYYNVVTDEKIPVKGMPFTDDEMGSTPIQYVLGVSPDKKTVIGSYDLSPDEVKGDSLVKLFNIDTESGKREIRFASLKKYPWLNDHQNPSNDIVPPPAPSVKFVWKKDTKGRDVLVQPELLGVFVRKQPPANK